MSLKEGCDDKVLVPVPALDAEVLLEGAFFAGDLRGDLEGDRDLDLRGDPGAEAEPTILNVEMRVGRWKLISIGKARWA